MADLYLQPPHALRCRFHAACHYHLNSCLLWLSVAIPEPKYKLADLSHEYEVYRDDLARERPYTPAWSQIPLSIQWLCLDRTGSAVLPTSSPEPLTDLCRVPTSKLVSPHALHVKSADERQPKFSSTQHHVGVPEVTRRSYRIHESVQYAQCKRCLTLVPSIRNA